MNEFIFWMNVIALMGVMIRLGYRAVRAVDNQVLFKDSDAIFFGCSLSIFALTSIVSLFAQMTWIYHMRTIVFGMVMIFVCGIILYGFFNYDEETLVPMRRSFITALIGTCALTVICYCTR